MDQPPKRRKTAEGVSTPVPALQSQTPTRASFMSPTRASLSRFNPSLLPQPRSASAGPSRQAVKPPTPAGDARSDLLARGQAALNYIMGGLGGNTPTEQPRTTLGEETDQQMEAMRAANAARRVRERSEAQRRHSESQQRDSLPPPEIARGSTANALPVFEDHVQDLEEDDLPETPEALRRQMEVEDTPPRGILFSSPAKQNKRKTRLKESVFPEQANAAVPNTSTDKDVESERPIKEVIPPKDPETIAKEEKKAALDKELKMLQSEIVLYEQFSKDQENPSEELEHYEMSELIALATSRKDQPGPTPAPLSSFLTAFLPFSIPVECPPTPSASLGSKGIIPSHEPLKETDPLPLLSLFTPLAMTSTVSAPSTPRLPEDPLLQKHEITLTGPSSLLTCIMDLAIASSAESADKPMVDALQLRYLSAWAKREVSNWLEERAREGDISTIGYALGRYWDISAARAQCWAKCCNELGDLVSCATEDQKSGALEKVARVVSKKRTQGRARRAETIEDEEVPDAGNGLVFKRSKKELYTHLGRQDLILKNDDVVFRVSWLLQLDWTGEVESVISGKAAFPKAWRETDDKNSLRKVPATFDVLMKERGVFDAIKIMSGLLFDKHPA